MKSNILIAIGLGLCMIGGCECPKNPFDPSQNNNGNNNSPAAPGATPTPVVPPVFSDASLHTFTLNPSAAAGTVGSVITFAASYVSATTVTFDIHPHVTGVTGQTNQLFIVVGYNGTIKAGIGFIPVTGTTGTVCYTDTSSPNPYHIWTGYGVMTEGYANQVKVNIAANSTGYSYTSGLTNYTLNGSAIGYGSNYGAQFNGSNSLGLPAIGWFIAAYSPTGGDLTGAVIAVDNIVVTQ